jgi:hypothetical protein
MTSDSMGLFILIFGCFLLVSISDFLLDTFCYYLVTKFNYLFRFILSHLVVIQHSPTHSPTLISNKIQGQTYSNKNPIASIKIRWDPIGSYII